MTQSSIADLAAALAGHAAHAPRWPLEGRIAAAVSVPLASGPEGLEVWFIKRPDGLRHHAREMAFPGGKPDPDDKDLLDTALRETEEELGVPRALLTPLGMLSPTPTATSLFTLHPYVVSVSPDADPVPAPDEVAALVRMPVEPYFGGRVGYRAVRFGGHLSPIFDFDQGSMYGASAHVLLELLDLYAEVRGLAPRDPSITKEIPWQ